MLIYIFEKKNYYKLFTVQNHSIDYLKTFLIDYT